MRRLAATVLASAVLAIPAAALAHAGKLDRCGCHTDPTGAGPHCHKLTRLPGCPGHQPTEKDKPGPKEGEKPATPEPKKG